MQTRASLNRPVARIALFIAGIGLAIGGAIAAPVRNAVALDGPQAAVGPGQQPAQPITGTGIILGRVVDAGTTSPVADAVVTLLGAALGTNSAFVNDGNGGGPRRMVTDAQGNFLFHDLPKGTYNMNVTAAGYDFGSYGQPRPVAGTGRVLDVVRPLELADGQRLGDVTIQIWKQGTLSGTVVDEANEPLVGVRVRVIAATSTWSGIQASPGGGYFVNTDDRGMYHIDMTPGDYLVSAGGSPTTMPATAIDEYQTAMAAGQAASRAYSDSLQSAGAPFPNPTGLRIGDLVVNYSSPLPTHLTDASDGRLFIYPTTYYPGSRTSTTATMITLGSGEQKAGIDLQLKPVPTYRVSGSLSGPDGPMPSMGVKLVVSDWGKLTSPAVSLDSVATVTDGHGEFTFLGVVPGQYTLQVLKRPVPDRGPTTTVTVSGAGGSSFSSVSVGAPAAASQASISWAAQTVTVDDADVSGLAVTLRNGVRVTGRVEFVGSGTPPTADLLKVMSIMARPVPGTIGALLNVSPITRVDEHSTFSSPQFVPGSYLLTATPPQNCMVKSIMAAGVDASDYPVDISANDLNDVVITITDRVSKISGAVRGADGQPAPDATVLVFPTDNKLWPRVGLSSRRERTTGPSRNGAYSFSGLPAGDYFLVAVSSKSGPDFTDPKIMTSLMSAAIRLTLADGDSKPQDLTIVTIK